MHSNRKSTLFPLGLCLAFAVVPAVVGCDKTVSKEETKVRKSDGSTSTEEKKTTQAPDGKVTEKTTEKTTNP